MSSEENKAVVRRWFAETDKGNLAIVDELCAPDYVDHSPPLPGMPQGSAGVHRANALLRAAFQGEILGIPPNGQVVEIGGIMIHRLVDGKLVEHWAQADLLSFMQQLGAIPAPAPPSS